MRQADGQHKSRVSDRPPKSSSSSAGGGCLHAKAVELKQYPSLQRNIFLSIGC